MTSETATQPPQIMSAQPMAVMVRPPSRALEVWSNLLQIALVYGLGGTVMYAVITFGAVEPWSLFGLEMFAAGLLVLWALQTATTRTDPVISPLFVPVLLFAGVVTVQILLHLSAYAYMTRSTALTYVVYGIVLLVAIETLRTESDLKRLMGFLAAFGFMVAIGATIQDLTSRHEIYWLVTVRGNSAIFGPYVNHNHYAGLMEMLVPFPLVLSMMEDLTLPKRILLAFAGIFMAGTIFLSLSRGGMTAFGFELVFLAAVLWWKNASRRSAMMLAVACMLIMIFLLWLGGKNLVQRFVSFKTDEASYHTRLQIVRDGLKMVKERPLLGWGLGTFPTVYPKFRTFYADVFINAAHNDYVQFLTETGLVGFGAVLWFLVLVYLRAFRKLRGSRLDLGRAATLAALVGITGILVHSFVDFNLQIPANATLFYLLAAIAAGTYQVPSSRRRRRSRPAI